MSLPVIRVENLSKSYRLGQIGTGTFANDLKLWWARTRRKPNPLLKIDEKDNGSYDGEVVWALRDVSFEVQQGEVLGIIGRNGAGKSTLLKILSRVTAPTSGQIKVKGRVASLLEVGTGFHPELTGRENIYLNGAILGMTKEEVRRKFDEIVAFSEVEKFIDTPVKRYSSGMYVRLAFAVAAHLEPEILVVDEVLAVGDAEFQKKCLGKMGNVAKEGRTVLFVSHNMGAVKHICGQAIVFSHGAISSKGEINDAIDFYLTSSSLGENNNNSSSEHSERSGNGEIKIQNIEIRNTKGIKIDAVSAGQTFDIYMDYVATSEYALKDVNFAIDCYSPMGQRIFIQSMNYSGFTAEGRLPQEGIMVCRIENLPLAKGAYFFTSVIKLKKMRVDVVEKAYKLTVIDSDFLNSTTSLSSNDVVCLVKGEWRLL